jgi:fibronectin type III domain protein
MNLTAPRRPRALIPFAVTVAIVLGLFPLRGAVAAGSPDAPSSVAATGNTSGSATVTWTPAATGASVASYLVQAFETNAGFAGSVTACSTCTSAAITGLIGSRSYQFVVYASNAAGSTAAISPVMTMPASLPTAPLDVRVDGRDKTLRVAWVPPADEGASLTGYSISIAKAGGVVVATATACAACTSALVTVPVNGTAYTATVRAQNSLGTGPAGTAPAKAATAVPPSVTNLKAAPAIGGTTLTWTAVGGTTAVAAADWFIAQAWGPNNSFIQAVACGTCRSLTMSGMAEGQSYGILLYAHNSAGFSKSVSTAVVTTSGQCGATTACVEADATRTRGAAALRAQGLLQGIAPNSDPARVAALNVKQWRISAGSPSAPAAQASTASVTMELSNSWFNATHVDDLAAAPWASWPRYISFVTAQVQNAKATGTRVDYWEIANEPNVGRFPTGTTELIYEQYRVAYNAIKSVDPLAKVIGPSLAHFWWVNGDANSPNAIDIPTFLNYADAHGMKLAAITWHENGIGNAGYYEQPQAGVDSVQVARALIAQHPGLGGPKVFINEYGSPSNNLVPGNLGGYVDAFERADVDQANTTCHEFTWGPGYQACTLGTLDGALLQDNQTPRGTYWMRVGYAGMQGTRLSTNSTDANITVFATADGTGGYKLMVSRHQGCAPSVNVYCNVPGAGPAPTPVTVVLKMAAASTTAKATGSFIPAGTDASTGPVPLSSVAMTLAGSVATVRLPAMADGDVYFINVK